MTKNILPLLLFIISNHYTVIAQPDNPKKLFDLLPKIPRNYSQTISEAQCKALTSLKSEMEEANKTIVNELSNLRTKVQSAYMSNPMIFTDEAFINLSQYQGQAYFTELTEEITRVPNTVKEKQNAFLEKLKVVSDNINKQYKCSELPAGSPQEEACVKRLKDELFSKEVQTYDEYLENIEQDLIPLNEKLKRFVIYVNDNIIAVKNKNNDAVKYHIYDACNSASLQIGMYSSLLEVYCSPQNFIHPPEK